MAKEIERKFLVKDRSYREMAVRSHHIVQGYISTRPEGTVRVRIKDEQAYLTVKGLTVGATRDEWEYGITTADARAMLERCTEGNVIDKTRYIVNHDGRTWEVDEFNGALSGLVVAEIELPSEDTAISLPAFVGNEITDDPRYYNSALSQRS